MASELSKLIEDQLNVVDKVRNEAKGEGAFVRRVMCATCQLAPTPPRATRPR